MQGRTFNPTIYSYGFGGQLKDDEIYGNGNSYSAEYWQYDPRLGRRWNIDPIVKPFESSYAAFNNNPIYFSDPSGLDGEPKTSGPDDDCHKGDTDSHGTYHSSDDVEISSSKGKAAKEWYSFIGAFAKSGQFEEYKNAIYETKLRSYQDGIGKLAYGTNSNGTVDVPASIKIRLANETENEALPALKSAWVANKTGIDPGSLSYTLNPFAQAQYASTRALTVTTKAEGWSLVTETSLTVAMYWLPIALSEGQVASAMLREPEVVVGENQANIIQENSVKIAGGEMPAMQIAKPLVTIETIENDVMIFSGEIDGKTVEGITNFSVSDGTLHLDKLHIGGSEAGEIGVKNLFKMAKDLGKQFNVKEVIIQGGKRTTGKFKGSVPSPISVKVN